MTEERETLGSDKVFRERESPSNQTSHLSHRSWSLCPTAVQLLCTRVENSQHKMQNQININTKHIHLHNQININ